MFLSTALALGSCRNRLSFCLLVLLLLCVVRVLCVLCVLVAGFEVAVPELDRARIDPMIFERSWTVSAGGELEWDYVGEC